MLPHDAIDMSGQLRKLLKGNASGKAVGGKEARNAMPWLPAHAAALRSAVTGGQWTQCRLKQAFPAVEDGRCQLCRAAPGDLAHRYACVATKPAGGWPTPPGQVAKALLHMAPDRRRWLECRWRG